MLGLRAVDVDGLVVGDGNHEHWGVTGLAVVVPVTATTVTATITRGSGVGASVGVAGNGLEVGEDGIPLRLARVVGGRRGNRVILFEISHMLQPSFVVDALPERRS